jgi:hypothetical protein
MNIMRILHCTNHDTNIEHELRNETKTLNFQNQQKEFSLWSSGF